MHKQHLGNLAGMSPSHLTSCPWDSKGARRGCLLLGVGRKLWKIGRILQLVFPLTEFPIFSGTLDCPILASCKALSITPGKKGKRFLSPVQSCLTLGSGAHLRFLAKRASLVCKDDQISFGRGFFFPRADQSSFPQMSEGDPHLVSGSHMKNGLNTRREILLRTWHMVHFGSWRLENCRIFCFRLL